MPFEIVRNDITKMHVDAVVNAANNSLLGGGGVDGAIHRAAGPGLLAECRLLNGCETGRAKITGGYNLPAKYVIHTVGPVWYGGGHGEKELLASCYRESLELAVSHDCETVAFPMISAGAYGYPKAEAMSVAVDVITRFLMDHDLTVYLVVFGRDEFNTGKKLFRDIQEFIDDVYAERHYDANVESSRRYLWHSDKSAAMDLDRELAEGSVSESCAAPEPDAAPEYFAAPEPDAAPEPHHARESKARKHFFGIPVRPAAPRPSAPDWGKIIRQTDEGFSAALLRLIDEKHMTDVECYKKANVDRKLFSKIRSNPAYKPGKSTVCAFAVALELDLRETKDLLRKAGFALTRSSKFDLIIEYCVTHGYHDVFEINEVLFHYDLPLLGSGTN